MMKFQKWMRNNTNLMERTILNYTRTIERFLDKYDEPTVENINEFISRSTRRSRSYYVKYAFMHYLKFIGKQDDYKKLIKIKERPKKKPGCYLPKEDLMGIVMNINNETHRTIALIQYLTGVRAGDILRFTRDNLIEKEGVVAMRLHQSKGEKKDIIVFIPKKYSNRITQFIKTHQRKYPFLDAWSDDLRKRCDNNYRYYFKSLKKSARELGFPEFGTHDFRRNIGEDVYKRTKDLRLVQKTLGHSKIETTIKYLKQVIDEDIIADTLEEIRG